MRCGKSDSVPLHDCRSEVSGRPVTDPPGRTAAMSSITLLLACAVELLCWIIGAVILYWGVPESIAAFRGIGVEAPRSMVRVINIIDWIVGWSWIAVPLIFAGIVAPKVFVFASTPSPVARAAYILAGWAVPLLLVVYGLGLPKMYQLGLWP